MDLVGLGGGPEEHRSGSSSLADMFGEAAGVTNAEDTCVDVITFVESSWGLGMGVDAPPLLPAQKFILKAYYGMPLDDKEKYIPVYDMFCENLLYMFTEEEFRKYLVDQGRMSDGPLDGSRSTLALVCGRRGTKTTITAMIACYEQYKMLLKYHPQKYFGVMPDDVISMTCLSTSESSAKILFDRAKGNMERSIFFKDYLLGSPNKTSIELKSKRDEKEFGGKKHTIEFIADACSARSLRGPNNIFVALDEVAHFFKDVTGKATSDKSDKAIYEAVIPSMAMYKNPDDTPAGKIILISSPAAKSGLLWEQYEMSFDKEKGSDILMVQLPSWEMNPLIPTQFLKAQYNKGPIVFDTEYGSQFSDRLSGWIDDPSMVRNCVEEDRYIVERSADRSPHFMGVDVGLKKDGTALAVVHIEYRDVNGTELPVIVLDWYGVRYAKDEMTYEDTNGGTIAFKPEEMGKWIDEVSGKFNIQAGVMDQYYALAVMPTLHSLGNYKFEDRHFNDTKNSEFYQNFMSKMMTGGVSFPGSGTLDKHGNPIDSPLVEEILKLQVIQKSKYVIKVFVPESNDDHDDLSDAVVRAVKLATEYLAGGKGSKKVPKAASTNRPKLSRASAMTKLDLKRPSQSTISRMGARGRFGGDSLMGGRGIR